MRTRISNQLFLLIVMAAVFVVFQGRKPHAEMILERTDNASASVETARNNTTQQNIVADARRSEVLAVSSVFNGDPNQASNSAETDPVAPVPEPSSLAMLLGLVGIVMLSRRVRRIWAA